jgi:tetratricopeptide (TPR) repeat protein
MSSRETLIRQELERLLNSTPLKRANNHQRLLRFLVEKALANDTRALKETTIGVEVFQRNPSLYDPKKDPIVRVSIARLRDRLAEHYKEIDAKPVVRIELPKGRYVPEFVEIGSPREKLPRLLVLPCISAAADETFATLLFEQVVGELQSVLQLAVLGTRSARAVADQQPLDSAKRVSADAVLSMRWDASHVERVQLHTMLISAPYGHLMSSERFTMQPGESVSAFVERAAQSLRNDCMQSVVGALPGEVTLPPSRRGFQGIPKEAIDAYLASRRVSRLGTADDHQNARTLLESAIAFAPDFALAHAALAATLGNLSMYERLTPEEAWQLGSKASLQAMSLDPNEPSAYINLAGDTVFYRFAFDEALELLTSARKLAPRHPGIYTLSGTAMAYQKRIAESLRQFDIAQELDPLFAGIRANRCVALMYGERLDEACVGLLALLAEHPQRSASRLTLAQCFTLRGAFDEARAQLQILLDADPDDASARLGLAAVHARNGDAVSAKQIIHSVQENSNLAKTNPSALAAAHCYAGDFEAALRWLNRSASAREGGFAEVQVNPDFRPIANDPRFANLLAKFQMKPLQMQTPT